jgi:anti-anti-sigma regulatory factor
MDLIEENDYTKIQSNILIFLLPEKLSNSDHTAPFINFMDEVFRKLPDDEYPHIIFDCTNVRIVRIYGLRLFGYALALANNRQKRVILAHVHPKVKVVIHFNEADGLFQQTDTVEEAINIITGGK